MKNVLVSLASDSNAMRECLIGIFEHVNSGHAMDIQLVPDPRGSTDSGLTPQTVDKALAAGLSGAITGIGHETKGFLRLVESGVPLVLNNKPPHWRPRADTPVSFVRSDDLAVGRMGARHLRAQGRFRSYAFVPCRERSFWSVLRRRGFELELFRHGIRPQVFLQKDADLASWLKSLPKPAAVMAASDLMAHRVIEACRSVRIKMPVQIAVLGVDNDEVICRSTRPTLSSVHPGNVELGHRCAAELLRLIRTGAKGRLVTVPPLGVVERLSTHTISPSGHLIQMALSHIQENLHRGISAHEVARALHVSESLLRLRFRTVLGKSVREVLLSARLEKARQLLTETDKPVREIAVETGFSSVCRFSHCFAEKHGVSPLAWRQAKGAVRKTRAPSRPLPNGSASFGAP